MDGEESRPSFLFVGNQLCLDFINTEMIVRGRRTDLLDTWADLVGWLDQAKVLAVSDRRNSVTKVGPAEGMRWLRGARAFRSALRELAEHVVAGKRVPESVIKVINTMLGHRPGYTQLVRTSAGFYRRFHSTARGSAQILAPVAEAAGDLLCHGDLSLVRKCRNDACILYFYDTTKNHARQWCSMGLCGNRIKVAAHYHRKRSARR